MIKVIGFDIGGVYLTNTFDKKIMKEISRYFRTNFDFSRYLENRELFLEASIGRVSEDECLTKTLPEISDRLDELKQFIRDQIEVYSPDLRGVILKLKESYTVVMMNNEIIEWNNFRIETFGFIEIFY